MVEHDGVQLMVFAELQDEVDTWAHEKGWYLKEVPFLEAMYLLTSEVVEAGEAYRENGFEDMTDIQSEEDARDGILPKPEGVGSEFADILIRLLNYSARFDVDLYAEYKRKMAYNRTRPYRHGGKLA
jgi:NTP pyrophosphatase (non-canonical NTP hydrolase)